MQITNDANLPGPLYQAIVAQQQQHAVGEADISCTQLIEAPLIAWMWRNYGDQVTEDAADRLWALYGSIAHSVLAGCTGAGHHVETARKEGRSRLRGDDHTDEVKSLYGLKFYRTKMELRTLKRGGRQDLWTGGTRSGEWCYQ